MNARLLLKAAAAIGMTLFATDMSLKVGFLSAPQSNIALIWSSAHLFLLLLLLTYSYISIGYKSRWIGIFLAQFFFLITTSALGVTIGLGISVFIGFSLGVLVFLTYTRWISLFFLSRAIFPENTVKDGFDEKLMFWCNKTDWNVRKFVRNSKTETTTYMVWNNNHCYVLYPINMEEKFDEKLSKKHASLTYLNKNINPWLLYQTKKNLPLWRSGNAPMMLVLFDNDSVNGRTAEAIGVSIPDSQKKIPVGIQPGKNFMTSKKNPLDSIDEKFGKYLPTLSKKNLKALDSFGRSGKSEYLDDNDNLNNNNVSADDSAFDKNRNSNPKIVESVEIKTNGKKRSPNAKKK